MSVAVVLLVIGVTIVLNALYVAAEFATVGARRARVQDAAERGSRPAGALLTIMSDQAKVDAYVAACQIGITLTSLIAGAYGQAQLTPLLADVLGPIGGRGAAVVVVLVGITAVQVVFGELLPKTAALRHPERLAMATLVPMRLSQAVFRPLVALFNGSAFGLMRLLGLRVDHTEAHVHSPEELAGLYRASAAGGLIDPSERDMLAGILDVTDRTIREIMTPRNRLVTTPADATVAEALARLALGPHTRFPVLEADDVIGTAHLRDLHLQARSDPGAEVRSVTRPVAVIGDRSTVPTLWRTLRDEGRHSALVINEYGDFVGFVTLEDAIEEIFGEVHDEFDLEDEPITVRDGRVSVRGDVLLSQLTDRFGVRFDTEGIDTVGGLVWHLIGRTPAIGDHVSASPDVPELRVDAMLRRSVMRVSFPAPPGTADDASDDPQDRAGEDRA